MSAEAAALAINGGEKLRPTPFGPRWVFGEEERAALSAVMDRAPRAWRNGEKVREFVTAFQSVFGVRGAIATGSGTAAVHAALGALDPEPGAEVITTPATDIGTIVAILQHNLIPVFADWGPDDFNTDPAEIERVITDRTAAIVVVHLFGFPCDMDAIMAIARRHGVPVVEDCAQAHLAEFAGKKVGTFGDLAAWSFGLKTLSTDQGGMVSAAQPELSAAARGFLSKGSVKVGGEWTPYSRLGTFSPMTDLQAAIGVAQVAKLEAATAIRQMAAAHFDEAFAGLPVVTLPRRRPGDRDVYYMYPYHFDEAAAGCSVAHFIEALRAEGISDAFGPYLKGRAMHRQPMLRDLRTYGSSGFPMRDEAGLPRVDYRSLHLPRIDRLLPGLGFFHMRNSFTEADAKDIAAAITKVGRGLGLTPRPVAGAAMVEGGAPAAAASAVSNASATATNHERAAPQERERAAATPIRLIDGLDRVNRSAPAAETPEARIRPAPTATPTAEPAPSQPVPPRPAAADPTSENPMRSAPLNTASSGAPSAVAAPAEFGVNFLSFGATPGVGPAARARNDAAVARMTEALAGRGGRVFVPRGVYEFGGEIALVRLRNTQFVGEGGNAKDPGTTWRFVGPSAGLSLRSSVHVSFDEMQFVGTEGAAPAVTLGCDTTGDDGLSTLSIAFTGCTFRSAGTGPGVLLQDCAMVSFRHCWFKGAGPAAQLGAPKSRNAISRSNGLANSITFEACHFTERLVAIRASSVRIVASMFSRTDSGEGAGLDCGTREDARVTNVTIADCFAIEAKGGTLFRQGGRGVGLVFENNRVAGYDTALEIDGAGAAVVRANLFQRMTDPIRVREGAEAVIEVNRFE